MNIMRDPRWGRNQVRTVLHSARNAEVLCGVILSFSVKFPLSQAHPYSYNLIK